jgi:hypothetical protein
MMKPAVISFQRICQSPRKLWGTSDHASTEVMRSRPRPLARGDRVDVAGVGLLGVGARVLLVAARDEHVDASPHQQDQHEPTDELGGRELRAEEDPKHDAELEDEVLEANMEAIAAGSPAPFWKALLAIAIAAYEHDDDAAPSPAPLSVAASPRPPSTRPICPRVTQACTTPESRKPRISAHHTSEAI